METTTENEEFQIFSDQFIKACENGEPGAPETMARVLAAFLETMLETMTEDFSGDTPEEKVLAMMENAEAREKLTAFLAEYNGTLNGLKKIRATTKTEALSIAQFVAYTSQEIDTLHRAQCDGKKFTNYQRNEQAGAIVYEHGDLSHQIRLALTEDDRAGGLQMTYLENLVRSQDADAAIATQYILCVLAPPPHLPKRPYAGGWIDFDDVITKIGWYPQTTIERHEMHAKIWGFVRFGEKAHINGKRKGPTYKDANGNEIDTTINGAAWRVMKTETPDPSKKYPASETPVRAEIVVSKELTALITSPYTAQYLPMAEILGAIPGSQAAGAWARVIGVALMSFWRRHPCETVHTEEKTNTEGNIETVWAPTLRPTRRELLDHFAAKVAPYEEILKSKNPARAIKYWCAALGILADCGFIERTGEAAIAPEKMRAALPDQGWKDIWLNEKVDIKPGIATMKPAIDERAKALPEDKPRDLKKRPRAKKKPKSQ